MIHHALVPPTPRHLRPRPRPCFLYQSLQVSNQQAQLTTDRQPEVSRRTPDHRQSGNLPHDPAVFKHHGDHYRRRRCHRYRSRSSDDGINSLSPRRHRPRKRVRHCVSQCEVSMGQKSNRTSSMNRAAYLVADASPGLLRLGIDPLSRSGVFAPLVCDGKLLICGFMNGQGALATSHSICRKEREVRGRGLTACNGGRG